MAEIPLAVAASVRSPGTALSVDLKAGVPSVGTGARRGLLLGIKSSAGTITPDTQLVMGVSGEQQVGELFGSGTPTHSGAKRLFEESGLAQIDVACVATPGGSAASGTFTLASSPTSDREIQAKIAGRPINSSWLAGETAIQGATRLVSKINEKGNDLPVTADNGGGALAVVTVTFKHPGNIGNDCRISCQIVGGAGGTCVAGAATLAGGTTEPDWTNVLALVSGRAYKAIVPCASNAEVVSATSTLIAGKLETHIALYGSGFGAKLQQAILGCTNSTNSSLKTGVAATNYERLQYVLARDAGSMPFEVACMEAGARLRDETVNPNFNRINQVYRATFYGPDDLVTGTPTNIEVEDDLQNGITPVSYDESGRPFVKRPVTSYFKTSTGAPDDRVLDVTKVSSTDAIAEDLAVFIEEEFKEMNIISDADILDNEEVPENTVTPKQIRAAVAGRMDVWFARGVALKSKFNAAMADGTFIVRQNPLDNGQVDLVVPPSIVRHLAKKSLVVQQR